MGERRSRRQEMPLEKGQKERAGDKGEGAAHTDAQRQSGQVQGCVLVGGGSGEGAGDTGKARALLEGLAMWGAGVGEDLLSSSSPNPKSGSLLCTLGLGPRFMSKLGSHCGCR